MMKLFKNQNPDRPIITIETKPADVVLEITGYIALAALWIYVYVSYQSLPDIVPIHFGAGGKPDGYGSKETTFLSPVIATVLFVFIAFIQRKPHWFNYPTEITQDNALKQYTNAVLMMRTLKMCLCIMFIAIEYSTTSAAVSSDGIADTKWMFIVIIFLVQIPLFWFIIQSSKNA